MKYEGVTKLDAVFSENAATSVHTNRKKRKKEKKVNGKFFKGILFQSLVCVLALGALFGLSAMNTPLTDYLMGNIQAAVNTNPDMFTENPDIADSELVAHLLGLTYAREESGFLVPASGNCVVSEGIVTITSDSDLIVKAAQDGIVKTITATNGYKIIEIIHEGTYVTRYSGVVNAGVKTGDKIVAGQVLGVSNGKLQFSIEKDGNTVQSIAVDEDTIYIAE